MSTAGSFERYEIVAPPFTPEDAGPLAAERFGFDGEVVELTTSSDGAILRAACARAR